MRILRIAISACLNTSLLDVWPFFVVSLNQSDLDGAGVKKDCSDV